MNVAHATAVIACRLPIMEQSPGRLVDDGEDTPKANGRNQWIADIGIRCNVNVRFFRFLTNSCLTATGQRMPK